MSRKRERTSKMPIDKSVDVRVQWLANKFFQTVIAPDVEWTEALATTGQGSRSQRVFYSGSPTKEGDVFDQYERWLDTLEELSSEEKKIAVNITDMVLFNVAKNVGSIDLVSSENSVKVTTRMSDSTAYGLAELGESEKCRLEEGGATFFFEDAQSALKFANIVGAVVDVELSKRVVFLQDG